MYVTSQYTTFLHNIDGFYRQSEVISVWNCSGRTPLRPRWVYHCQEPNFAHNASPTVGVLFTMRSIKSDHLSHRGHTAYCRHKPPVQKQQCRLKNTTAEVINASLWSESVFVVVACKYNDKNDQKFWTIRLPWLFSVSVSGQVRSWWITSLSTWSPSGRGKSFQTWHRTTWGSWSRTLPLWKLRIGRVSSKISRES